MWFSVDVDSCGVTARGRQADRTTKPSCPRWLARCPSGDDSPYRCPFLPCRLTCRAHLSELYCLPLINYQQPYLYLAPPHIPHPPMPTHQLPRLTFPSCGGRCVACGVATGRTGQAPAYHDHNPTLPTTTCPINLPLTFRLHPMPHFP